MKRCLIYTVKNDSTHLSHLENSLKMARDNLFPFVKDLDILFFHDASIDGRINAIVDSLKISNKIFMITFTTQPPASATQVNFLQYGNMCRFWTVEVFRHSKVLEYDYYMRLDCDSFITGPVGYDLFDALLHEDKDYAYLTGGKFLDSVPFFQGLNNALREFEAQFPERMKNPVANLQEGLLYYTNFEICRIKAFTESLYMNLCDHIDRVGGIYKYRWGDHIIRYAGIHLILGFDRVKEIAGMKYTHQRFIDGIIV